MTDTHLLAPTPASLLAPLPIRELVEKTALKIRGNYAIYSIEAELYRLLSNEQLAPNGVPLVLQLQLNLDGANRHLESQTKAFYAAFEALRAKNKALRAKNQKLKSNKEQTNEK